MAKAGIKVRGEWLKMYKTLHTWVGICSGLLLFVGFFAGALTMFEEPLQRWANPPQDNLRPASEMTTAELGQLVDTVLQQHPAARKDMTVHLQDGSPAPVVWHEGPFSRDIDLQASEFQASLDTQGQLQVRQYVPGQLAELIDHGIGRVGGNRTLFEGTQYATAEFVFEEGFAFAALLDDKRQIELDGFKGGEALVTVTALATSTDLSSVGHQAGIDHLGF